MTFGKMGEPACGRTTFTARIITNPHKEQQIWPVNPRSGLHMPRRASDAVTLP